MWAGNGPKTPVEELREIRVQMEEHGRVFERLAYTTPGLPHPVRDLLGQLWAGSTDRWKLHDAIYHLENPREVT
jgi:hypothetical protein